MDQYVGAFGSRGGPRSKTGCATCRKGKVKCDEIRPVCHRCARLSKRCDWTRMPRKIQSRPSRGRARHVAAAADESPGTPALSNNEPSQQSLTDDNDSDPIGKVSPGQPSSPSPSSCQQTSPPQTSSPPKSPPRSWATPSPDTSAHSSMRTPTAAPTPAEETASCGLPIDPEGHKAIFLYRTMFASSVDTKNPAYSLPAIVLRAAASAPSAMHMVQAIGRQLAVASSVQDGDKASADAHSRHAVDHYCQALRRLGDVMAAPTPTLDLDTILATIWLMAVYEQRFGEHPVQAIAAHFQGVASVLKAINLTQMSRPTVAGDEINQPHVTVPELSYLSARILLFLLNMDARTAGFGLNGVLNTALAQSLGNVPWSQALQAVHERSAPLFQTTWGTDYPTTETVYDIEHRGVFELLRDASQLRLLVAEISGVSDADEREARLVTILEKAEALDRQHIDLFVIANKMLNPNSSVSQGLATSLCWVMPHYYVAILDLLRAAGLSEYGGQGKHVFAQSILQLAMHGYRNDGPAAIVRIAWPLFLAGLETPDLFQQHWVVDRLHELASFGAKYKAVALLLKDAQARGLRGNDDEYRDLAETIFSRQLLI